MISPPVMIRLRPLVIMLLLLRLTSNKSNSTNIFNLSMLKVECENRYLWSCYINYLVVLTEFTAFLAVFICIRIILARTEAE